jgi:hypothetical protein
VIVRAPQGLVVLGLSAIFLLLGILFIAVPRWGAFLYGIPAPDGVAASYVRAIGFRDMALALYMAVLTLWSTPRALSLVLGLTVLIPVLDLALLLTVIGVSSPGHLALHGASGVCFAGLALWVAGTSDRNGCMPHDKTAHSEQGGS